MSKKEAILNEELDYIESLINDIENVENAMDILTKQKKIIKETIEDARKLAKGIE